MDSEEVSFASRDAELGGTLTFPQASGRCPAVVLIGGSGPSDRHNGGFFDQLSEHLTARGVLTLTYDKRGVAASSGSWEDATVDDLASDAAAAHAMLRRHERAAPDAVGVIGHSEGGWVALRLCAHGHGIAHVVLNSCPAVPFLASEVFALTAAGVPRASAERAGELLGELASAARAGRPLDHGLRRLAVAQREEWYAPLAASGLVLDAASWAQLGAWGDYDPSPDLSVLALPTLVILGSKDPLVPVEASRRRYEETAATNARRQEIAIFPDAGHRLQNAVTHTFASGYLERLSSWCLHPGETPGFAEDLRRMRQEDREAARDPWAP